MNLLAPAPWQQRWPARAGGAPILQMEMLRVSEAGIPPKRDRMGQGQRQGPALGGGREKLGASGLNKRPGSEVQTQLQNLVPLLNQLWHFGRITSLPRLSASSTVKRDPFLGEYAGTAWCMVALPPALQGQSPCETQLGPQSPLGNPGLLSKLPGSALLKGGDLSRVSKTLSDSLF